MFLHHDRPIVRPADDPVFRVINKQPAPIRQGRGLAPVEIELPFELDSPVLAVGAHMKNTVTLAWENRAVVSPHIGEMFFSALNAVASSLKYWTKVPGSGPS